MDYQRMLSLLNKGRKESLWGFRIFPPVYTFKWSFWKEYSFLNETEFFDRNELEEIQLHRLRGLLVHAYENVPYYRRIFLKHGVNPYKVDDLDVLQEIPTLDKTTFKKYRGMFYAKNINRKNLHLASTSGTTGTPLVFHRAPEEPWKEMAHILHQWRRVGYSPYTFRLEIRGKPINPFDFEITGMGSVRVSPVISSVKQAEFYLWLIRRLNIKYIHGYPSSIMWFARMIDEHGLDTKDIKLNAVLFASEEVFDFEAEIVRRVFNTKVFAHYGQAEHVALAAYCEHSRSYHFIPQYSVVEIDPKSNEIVGTGFLNTAVPFIRYKTSDVAINPSYTKCKCGRAYFPIVENVVGRLEDFLVTSEGNIISPAVITHVFKNLKTVNAIQIIQEDYEDVIINIEPLNSQEITKQEIETITNYIKQLLGANIKLSIRVVEKIPREGHGKFKWIISKPARSL